MKKILFITTRDPFSGKFSGDVIRSAKIINFLKKSYNIDVVFLGKKDRLDTSDKSVIEFKHPNFFLKLIFCIISFFKLKPIQFGIFFSPKLKKFVKDNAHKYDVLFFIISDLLNISLETTKERPFWKWVTYIRKITSLQLKI